MKEQERQINIAAKEKAEKFCKEQDDMILSSQDPMSWSQSESSQKPNQSSSMQSKTQDSENRKGVRYE